MADLSVVVEAELSTILSACFPRIVNCSRLRGATLGGKLDQDALTAVPRNLGNLMPVRMSPRRLLLI
jgi:hypothetical protein